MQVKFSFIEIRRMMGDMWKSRVASLIIVLVGAGLAFLVYRTNITGKKPFRLGLDLSGGSQLTYRADTTTVPPESASDSLSALRDVIEHRVNAFGISEPNVSTETAQTGGEKEYRLLVELPGITNLNQAIAMIGKTPLLEFKEEKKNFVPKETSTIDDMYVSTGLTGKYLKRASVQFDSQNNQPYIALEFNDDGARLFEQITARNIGKTLAVYLDGVLTQAPVVNDKISGGQAIITGVTAQEARDRAKELNLGALPLPVELIGTNTIGPSLGADAISAGIRAGVIGFLAIVVLLVFWYRLPGLVASVSLVLYGVIMLVLFKFLSVTLTAPGIAGFVISIGMAVDANILIFERMKEELALGKTLAESIRIGFDRAWLSIRDGNVSSLISAVILYALGTTLMQGFALTFGIGVFISMLSAILISKVFLKSLASLFADRGIWLWKNGISMHKK